MNRMLDTPPSTLESGQSGRDYFAGIFSADVQREAEWLRRTAPPKVASIRRLLRSAALTPASILEIGAGTGAVIGALRAQGVGTTHYAADFSDEALGVLRATDPDVKTAVADVTETPDPFGAGPYDLAFASHVVEHLEQPEAFLRALRDVPTGHFIAEVPLEDLFFGRLKERLLHGRATHSAGHVQFFTRETFTALLERSGWRVLDVVVYAPTLDAETFAFQHAASSVRPRLVKRATEVVLPRVLGPLWTRTYHAHCAALCVRA